MSTAALADLLETDSGLNGVAPIAAEIPFVKEALHQTNEIGGSLADVYRAASVAEALHEDQQVLEAGLGTLTNMLMWGRWNNAPDEWMDKVATHFSEHAQEPAIVIGLANLLQTQECQHMHSFYSGRREKLSKNIDNPHLKAAVDALKDQPKNAARFATKMMAWSIIDQIYEPFAQVAVQYAPIEGGIQAFLDYNYQLHGVHGNAEPFAHFIETLANPRVAESARSYAGKPGHLGALMKLADYVGLRLNKLDGIRSGCKSDRLTPAQTQKVIEGNVFRENEPDLLAEIANSCAAAPDALIPVAEGIAKEFYGVGKKLDWLDFTAKLQDKNVQNALKTYAERPEVLSTLVGDLVEAACNGKGVGHFWCYSQPRLVETVDALETPERRQSFVAAAGKMPEEFSMVNARAPTSFFIENVREFKGEDEVFHLMMQTYSAAAESSNANKSLRYVHSICRGCREDSSDKDYTAHPQVLTYILTDIIKKTSSGSKNPDLVSSVASVYTQEPIRKAFVILGEDKDAMKKLSGSILSVLPYEGQKELSETVADQTVALSADEATSKTYSKTLGQVSSALHDKTAVGRFLGFVEEHQGSTGLRRAMDYFYRRVLEDGKTMKPADFIAMVDAYPVARTK